MILTLGYTGTPLIAITCPLDARQAVLCDIRYRLFSRNPVYRQKALQEALGPRYVHVPALGNATIRVVVPSRSSTSRVGRRRCARCWVNKVFALLTDPSTQDTAQLKGYPYRRVDSGEYRIIYAVEASLLLVHLIRKRNDDDIYKRLGRRS